MKPQKSEGKEIEARNKDECYALCFMLYFVVNIFDVSFTVLIVSYDLFRLNSKLLSKSKNIGLLVVDEGHRLKNTSGSLTLSALETLNCKARLLITGTPIQNNLSEFYNVANFAIPGKLGDLNTFRRGKFVCNDKKSCETICHILCVSHSCTLVCHNAFSLDTKCMKDQSQ